MDIKNKNFLLTESEDTRKVLLEQGLIEMKKQGKYFVFINEPKKLHAIHFEKLDIVPTNKLCF